MDKPPTDFFTKEHAAIYDEKNRALAPISDTLHFLGSLVLKDLPPRARILSVGAGTGAEIVSIARSFPESSFVAVEPSLSMLDVCRARMRDAGLTDRCEFFHGYAEDLPEREEFDATLAIFVAHFVRRADRLGFYRSLTRRLRVGGYLVNAEISFDMESAQFPWMLKNWESIQALMGATPQSLKSLPQQFRDVLTVLSGVEVESMLRQSDIDVPIRFFQAFMISAWYGVKRDHVFAAS